MLKVILTGATEGTADAHLKNGPSFAPATPEGLALRQRVLASSPPIGEREQTRLGGGIVASRRAHVNALMAGLEEQGLGSVSRTELRDRFTLAPGLPAAMRLTALPDSPSFIRSEDGSLLFRPPADDLVVQLTAILPNTPAGGMERRLKYR